MSSYTRLIEILVHVGGWNRRRFKIFGTLLRGILEGVSNFLMLEVVVLGQKCRIFFVKFFFL